MSTFFYKNVLYSVSFYGTLSTFDRLIFGLHLVHVIHQAIPIISRSVFVTSPSLLGTQLFMYSSSIVYTNSINIICTYRSKKIEVRNSSCQVHLGVSLMSKEESAS